MEIPARRVQIVHCDTSAGSSISDTLGKKRVLKIELSTRRIKKFWTIHVRERDSRLVCVSSLLSGVNVIRDGNLLYTTLTSKS